MLGPVHTDECSCVFACAHVCAKCCSPCVEIFECMYVCGGVSTGVGMRACGLDGGGSPSVGRSESCRAQGGQVGCLGALSSPAASDRAPGGGRGQRLGRAFVCAAVRRSSSAFV